MTDREKRIITLFSKYGALSKRELAEREGISWATAVKRISRLEKAGIVHCVGTDAQPEITGKNPQLYDLTDRNPLAIGIDVSYSTTNIILTNLKNAILAQYTCQTLQKPDVSKLQEFLVDRCLTFGRHHLTEDDPLEGIGIGIPLWLARGKGENTIFSSLDNTLEARLQTTIRIGNNVRSYTMYKKWAGKAFSLDDFILITIRSGIGTGIFYQGELMRGAHGMAGELSHLTIVEDGKRCRCGRQGCLETLVNQDVLYQEYLRNVLHKTPIPASFTTEAEVQHGLVALFSLAKQGHENATAVIQDAAHYIGRGIAALLKILDIPHIIIAADFGRDGDVLIPHITSEVKDLIIPGIDFSVVYYPLDQLGFARGAALLILKEYLTTL